MKPFSFILLVAILTGICGFKSDTTDVRAKDSLAGTWVLISFKYGHDKYFSDVPSFVQYRKVLTATHYSWVAYSENGDDVIGSGGGTYTTKPGKYTEKIDYFHPHTADLIGTSTTFESKLNGNMWAISGTIKALKLNPKTGEKEVVGETSLSEVWQRIE